MACLRDLGYRGVSLRDAVAGRDSRGEWPERSVVITFDDGYANVLEHGLPVLSRVGFGATVFVVTDHVGGWNDWDVPPGGLGRLAILSWAGLAELAEAGLEMGAHTQTHRDLTRLSDGDARREIVSSRKDIEDKLQRRVESFAYPFGSVGESVRGVARREFRAACTTVLSRAGSGPLEILPRVDAYYLGTTARLRRCIEGRLDRYLTMRRWGRAVRGLGTGSVSPVPRGPGACATSGSDGCCGE